MNICSYIEIMLPIVDNVADAVAEVPVGIGIVSVEDSERLAQTYKAIADPTRVRMLHALSLAELPVCEIARLVQISESAASHQLGLLRALRFVRRRKVGRHVLYTLDDEHIRELIQAGLAHLAHS